MNDQTPIEIPGGAETSGAALTPMMAQFFSIKAANPGYLLFYRMGDFYELFFEDAEIAAAALGIVLTKRGRHLGRDIEMCGVPVHAAQDYLRKLIGLGHRVAVCEQLEDPAEAKKRGGKSVVKRDVVRLVTRGTITEDELLPARGSSFLLALAVLRHGEAAFALAWADVSTGETFCLETGAETLGDELMRIAPAEVLVSAAGLEQLEARQLLPAALRETVTLVEAAAFDSEAATLGLRAAFGGEVDPTAYPRGSRAALGALFAYVRDSQKGKAVALRPPAPQQLAEFMAIDPATRASLELTETQRGASKGSLRDVIDLTVTSAGSRLFVRWLSAPLADPVPIGVRHDGVAALLEAQMLRDRLRLLLKAAPDLTRALTRLSLERGGPRDLVAIGAAVRVAQEGFARLQGLEAAPAILLRIIAALGEAPAALAETLARAIAPEPPLGVADGGFVAKGYDEVLDGERALGTETRGVVAALNARLVEETGLKALRIRHNGVLGYFVEVPAAQGGKLLEEPHRQGFIHRQTLANAMRFTTSELAELEGRIARAHEAALEIELRIFRELTGAVLAEAERLRAVADALAELDVLAALAQLAATRNWCRPVVDGSLAFAISGGRHPVVEQGLKAGGASFVANDCDLSGDVAQGGGQLWLLTGPNMGGKSTFLRQNALIAVLAQMGSYVPAVSAHLGVVDRVFSRVGASDDIAHGRSTFMVEMVETATILNRATEKSLVILDEIGRGTATFDGLSIAWAAVEALHNGTGCRGLFATHFHEMTSLQKTLTRVTNHSMTVREWEGEVVFLHEVAAGAADRSYGIQVARLAGLPEAVLKRARQVLGVLEQRSSGASVGVLDDLPLFAHRPEPLPRRDPLADLIDATRPDDLTPRDAIELIYELKKIRDASRRS